MRYAGLPIGFATAYETPKLQSCDLQAEKRGNFVVIGCVENSRVVSWSLNVCLIVIIYSPK